MGSIQGLYVHHSYSCNFSVSFKVCFKVCFKTEFKKIARNELAAVSFRKGVRTRTLGPYSQDNATGASAPRDNLLMFQRTARQ